MELLVVIIALVFVIFLVLCLHWNSEKETYGFGMACGWLMAVLCIIETICIYEITSEPQPKAIDVYQGKTTLKYEVIEGEIVDSCVVWKEEK